MLLTTAGARPLPLCYKMLSRPNVSTRSFHLPREITAVFVAVLYIHTQANVNFALSKLYDGFSRQQNKHREGFYIIAVDFNQTNLKTVLPRFY